jgi:hypothetical protein
MKVKKSYRAYYIFLLFTFVVSTKSFSQVIDSVTHRNIGLLAGCSILESSGVRLEMPAYFYSSRRYGFSVALAGKFGGDNPFAPGINAGLFYFLEPSFRDITFFANYNAACYFEKNAAITHIFGIGTQIDVGKRGFIQHSLGIGLQQSTTNFNSVGACGQLKLSIGLYLREIPVVHIHED